SSRARGGFGGVRHRPIVTQGAGAWTSAVRYERGAAGRVCTAFATYGEIVIGAAIGYLFARGRLAAAAAAADERARSADERSKLVESQLAERFQALSAQVLDASTARFLEVAEGRLQAANATAAGELEVRRAAVEQLIEPMLQ